jgi:predicted  nucleic acid-binding Zn-ribbon protein
LTPVGHHPQDGQPLVERPAAFFVPASQRIARAPSAVGRTVPLLAGFVAPAQSNRHKVQGDMSSQNVGTDVLRTLHRIHRQLADLNGRLQRGPAQIHACEASVTLRVDGQAARMTADRKQLQLKASEEKVQDLKRKLLKAESNREFQALKDQIDAQEMANSVLTDEILEELEKVDALQQKIAEAEEVLAKARDRGEKVRSEVAQQEPLIRADLARLEAELKECESVLPATVRELYQRVVRQRGEDALAAVENEYCSGCHQHVPVNVCAEIMLSHPMFCKTCGRLLYMPEDRSPE